MQFCSSHSPGKSGIGITIKDYSIKSLLLKYFFNSTYHFCRLHTMTTRANTEIVIRLRNSQLIKKNLRHI